MNRPRPIKRWKSKSHIIGRKKNSYVRLNPNFGFKFGKFHYCRARGKHKGD